MGVTIKDVARHAGVSPAIISRILNNDISLSIKDTTRQKVLDSIVTLNYRPNPVARGLRCNSTAILGMIVPDIANPFFVDIIKGAQTAAMESGYCLMIINTEEKDETETKTIEILSQQRVDGILNLSAHMDQGATNKLNGSKLPYVLVNRNSADGDTSFVGLDNVEGAVLAVEHLIGLRHRKIAHITGPGYTDTGIGRLQGYRMALMQHKIAYRSEYCVEAPFTFEGGLQAITKLCSLPDRPTAVFASNDLIAMGAIAGASALSLNVPNDLSIIGFNDIWLAQYTMPPLSTVYFDNYLMGYEACKMLISKIVNPELKANMFILKPKLVVRQSTIAIKA